MWLTVQGGFTFSLWLASPAEGCPGRTTMTRSWSPSSAGMGMFGARAGGPCRGRGTECGAAANPRVGRVRSGMTRPVPQGLGRADGGRAVVTVCDEPLARGGGVAARGRSGLVWCKSGLPAGISTWSGLLLVGWRAARLSRSCHKRCETWWDAGGYVETVSAGRREGRDELGQVNMVSR